jgi:UDP-N-acetylmuramoylalanine--D-glutamate ligase
VRTDCRVDAAGNVLVLGLGTSGRAAIELIDRLGGRSFVTDDRPGAAADQLPTSCELIPADDVASRFGDLAGVVTSPGIPKNHPILAAAEASGLAILSEPAFAAQYISAPLLAVTGTNGKSTTVSLLGEMLEAAGLDCFVGGNLGTPLCEAAGRSWDAVVVEISSFQLEWPGSLRPTIAAILNLSPDHLDRHGDMQTYARTKLGLVERMPAESWVVVARDDRWWEGPLGGGLLESGHRITTFGRSDLVKSEQGIVAMMDPPRLHAEDGWEVELVPGWPESPFDWDNVAAAAEIARRFGVPSSAIRAGVESFEPLAHRLALVGSHLGVEYWNDSKATNVGAALRSLEGFGRPVILLAGGVAKGAQFGALAASAGIKQVLAYGEAAGDIRDAITGSPDRSVRVEVCSGLRAAFDAAAAQAKVGDIVLLAPACASFDEFGNYAERGRAFVAMVEALGT